MVIKFLVKNMPDSIWFLHGWMLSCKKLNTIMLKIIIYNNLIISRHPNCPLFKFTSDSLSTLFCHTRNITFGSSILEAKIISILNPYIFQLIKYRTLRSTGKYWSRFCVIFESAVLSETSITSFINLSISLWLFPYPCKYFLNRPKRYFSLSNISSIQAIDTVGSKNTCLKLYHFLLSVSFLNKECKFTLDTF